MSCFGQKPRWLTSWLKGVVLITSGMDERDERKRTSVEASKLLSDDIKTEGSPLLQEEYGGDLPTGHAVSGV
jgi:hypothetical protein